MGMVLKKIFFSIFFQNGGKSKMAAKTKIIVKYACWVPNESSQQDQKLGGIYFLVTKKTKWRPEIQNGRQNQNCYKVSKLYIKLIVRTKPEAWWCLFFSYSENKMAPAIQNGRQNQNCRKLSKLYIKLIGCIRLEAWWRLFFNYSKNKMVTGDPKWPPKLKSS